MATIQLTSKIQARRLENNGFPRTGKKSVEANLEETEQLLEDDRVEVEKVSLKRSNSDAEAAIIDSFIVQGYEKGKHKTVSYVSDRKPRPREDPEYGIVSFNKCSTVKLTENSLTIYRQFENILSNKSFSTMDFSREEFEEAKEKSLERYSEKIEKNRKKLEQLKENKEKLEQHNRGDVVREAFQK